MSAPPVRCTSCGGTMKLDDLRGTNCPYCGQVLQHHARAAEHAAVINQVLDQQVHKSLGGRPYPGGASPQVPYQFGAPMPDYAQQATAHVTANMKKWIWITVALTVIPALLIVGIAVLVVILGAL